MGSHAKSSASSNTAPTVKSEALLKLLRSGIHKLVNASDKKKEIFGLELRKFFVESEAHWRTQESRVQGVEAKSSLRDSKVLEHEKQLQKHEELLRFHDKRIEMQMVHMGLLKWLCDTAGMSEDEWKKAMASCYEFALAAKRRWQEAEEENEMTEC
jgi:hypothetical protein